MACGIFCAIAILQGIVNKCEISLYISKQSEQYTPGAGLGVSLPAPPVLMSQKQTTAALNG